MTAMCWRLGASGGLVLESLTDLVLQPSVVAGTWWMPHACLIAHAMLGTFLFYFRKVVINYRSGGNVDRSHGRQTARHAQSAWIVRPFRVPSRAGQLLVSALSLIAHT